MTAHHQHQATNLKQHPALTHVQQLKELIKPLQPFGITYFAYVFVDQHNDFHGISTDPSFMQHYMNKSYYAHGGLHLYRPSSAAPVFFPA